MNILSFSFVNLIVKIIDMVKRTKCQVYSRIVGYLSPLSQWNPGKLAEWSDRKMFKIKNV